VVINVNHDYILITPAKNEEKSLPAVLESVVNQSILPKLWIIIDDGSTDRTPEIISSYQEKYNWIKSLRLPEHPRDVCLHYAYVCRIGFDYAIKHCREKAIRYDFVGLLDSDTILEKKYFEKLINEFEKDPSLGIASGGIYYRDGNDLIWEVSASNFPRGTGRIWSKKCFFDTGGYALEPDAHTISNIKSLLRGYTARQFKNVVAIQTRKTKSAEGFWKGYNGAGRNAYYLCKRPLVVLANVLYLSFKSPFYPGLAYLIGYLSAYINREPRIQDEEIRNYFRKQKLSRVLRMFET